MTTATAATVTEVGMAMGLISGGAKNSEWDYGHGLMVNSMTMNKAAIDIALVMAIVVDAGGASDAKLDDGIGGT